LYRYSFIIHVHQKKAINNISEEPYLMIIRYECTTALWLKSSLRKFYGRHHDLVDRYGISLSQMTTAIFLLVVNTSRSFLRSWLTTGFVTRLTRRVSLVKQELLTFPEHLISPPVFSGIRVISRIKRQVKYYFLKGKSDHKGLTLETFGHEWVSAYLLTGWLTEWMNERTNEWMNLRQ
jgi:hypothetical protein